ncbi:CDP-diacylglycerol-glycerol-3-phosphate 3-phosphatidyltransferase [Desarmillaria tabescens]|uniref:CDP-diacylglycerol--glycerol-3-phosphate 3-phosphatidyltransferase n=1 Tax=Armillaria tabescens TaxID=1929756 RepID=A0AA39NPQ3_ARMTA|nr:CDP-diacylglycerol-glycerol-3-phosphate 3-phosphatidyltransferase [Desarmillaria tabescens]KAK0469546.1 CDP-diacylglycerol-glycerol-3-phosphate 3-phosphatidyltransferase [Desarmillaria tabescens]
MLALQWAAVTRVLPLARSRLARPASTSAFDTAIHNFGADLRQRQPTFSIPTNGIQILSQPSEFYALILDMIQRAQNRIFLSSLYIGSGQTELIASLSSALQRKPALQLHLQLDLNRSTRPGSASTARLLLPLLRAFPQRVHVHLFRSPSLRGLLAKVVPPRFNEGWGTWHAKIYGADDDVLISGANLNESYFSNRQDRYIYFSKQKQLANYCFQFLKVVSTCAYMLSPAEDMNPSDSTPYSYRQEDYIVHWPDPDTHPHNFNEKLHKALSTFQESHRQSSSFSSSPGDVTLFPIVQGGQFGIREEETAIELLFKHLRSISQVSHPFMDLTSGYFNLYRPYQNLLLTSPGVDVRVLAASPKANGFYGSKGISSRIPEGYTILERRFIQAVDRAGRSWQEGASTGIQLNEWEKEGWTYHAKGLWLSPTAATNPILTLFGSTNLNARSAHIDTELSFLMLLQPPNESEGYDAAADSTMSLGCQLADEIRTIRSHAYEWSGYQRAIRPGTRTMLRIVEDML